MPYMNDLLFDLPLQEIETSATRVDICSQEPATYTEATSTYTLGNKTGVTYTGPAEWGYRRFILHYAHLCAAAGGVAAFCIGSELRALTQIRGAGDSFPSVAALQQLAAEVRAILPAAKLTYAADWSE